MDLLLYSQEERLGDLNLGLLVVWSAAGREQPWREKGAAIKRGEMVIRGRCRVRSGSSSCGKEQRGEGKCGCGSW